MEHLFWNAALLGVSLGADLLVPSNTGHSIPRVSDSGGRYIEAMSRWDGQWYLQIATAGYSYSPEQESSVAFFPLYPLLVRSVGWLTGMRVHLAGILVSHLCLVGAMWLLVLYVRGRFPGGRGEVLTYTALACAFFPTSFFMRMVYTESLFLFLSLLTFVAIERRWPLVAVALIAGFATAARSVGVALALVLAFHVWEQSASWRQALLRLLYLGPLAVWGLLAYMAFQWSAFGDPLAFVKTQEHWHLRPPVGLGERLLGLASWEPIWSVYTPGRYGYWAEIDRGVPMTFSYHLSNPTIFLLTAGLLVMGATKKWLSTLEIIFGVCLLAIPYVMVGHSMCMASQGRYMSVVFPMYVVLGNVFSRLPPAVSAVILAFSAFYLVVFSAMFAADYYIV